MPLGVVSALNAANLTMISGDRDRGGFDATLGIGDRYLIPQAFVGTTHHRKLDSIVLYLDSYASRSKHD